VVSEDTEALRLDDLVRRELHRPRGRACAYDLPTGLNEITCKDRTDEIDAVVRAEEPFISIMPDEQLGSHVAE